MKLLLTSTLEHFGPKLPLVFGDKLKVMDVLCIHTAALAEEGHEEWLPLEQQQVRDQVRSYSEFDIKGHTQEDLLKALDEKNVVYVTGGNTYHLLDCMNKINFKAVLNDFFAEGGIYLGTSAGSIVTGADIDFIRPMEGDDLPEINTTGLNLVDFSIIPHLDSPHFKDCIEACIENGKALPNPCFALNDDQALWVEEGCTRVY